MKHLPKEFKESLISKSLQPSGPTLRQLAEEHQLPVTTVYSWKRAYAKDSRMSSKKKYSPEEKLKLIVQLESLSESEAGELLRSSGLHSADIEEWKANFRESQRGPGRPKKDPELAKLQASEKELKRELRRKDKALAEMSARVVLLKKSHEIWGAPEDDE